MHACKIIPDDQVSQIFVFLDGSSTTIDSEPVMSWGFCCFEVDAELNHDLFFSSGGIMRIDKDSDLCSGAETCTSCTAELQANVMARLWLLQSGIPNHTSIIFLYDNKSAADAVIGKSESRTNSTMCKVGIPPIIDYATKFMVP